MCGCGLGMPCGGWTLLRIDFPFRLSWVWYKEIWHKVNITYLICQIKLLYIPLSAFDSQRSTQSYIQNICKKDNKNGK